MIDNGMCNRDIVNEIIKLDRSIKDMKKKQDKLKAKLQSSGLIEMENKNIKFVQYYSSDGNVDIMYKKKMDIDNIVILKNIFGEILDAKIAKKEEVKYEIDSKFKNVLIAIYMDDYKKHNVASILLNLGLDDNNIKLAMKKLKGDYASDKKLLESLGAIDEDGLEEEIDAIRENKNYEMIDKYIGIENIDDVFIANLKRAISVEEVLSIGVNYE